MVGSMDIAYWGLFFTGSTIVMTGSYTLGRMDAINAIKRKRPLWVAVSDHGMLGLEPADFFRSRKHAESYRRRLAGTEKIEVMTYDEWLSCVVERLKSEEYWDGIERLERWIEQINNRIRVDNEAYEARNSVAETQRLNLVETGVEDLSQHVDSTDGVLTELAALVGEVQEHARRHRENEDATDDSGYAGATMVRSPRGLVAIGRDVETGGAGNESRQESVEG
jgi:hypothetical protein